MLSRNAFLKNEDFLTRPVAVWGTLRHLTKKCHKNQVGESGKFHKNFSEPLAKPVVISNQNGVGPAPTGGS